MPAVTVESPKKRSSRRDSDSTQLILPAFRQPQLASLERQVPSGNSWLFEMKFDGYRMQAAIAGDQVRLLSDWYAASGTKDRYELRSAGSGSRTVTGA